MSLWFSSPPSSPVKESGNTFGLHGVEPPASVDEKGASLIQTIPPSNVKWLLDNHGASEAMAFYVRFNDDSFAYAQIAYSSVGLSPSSQVTIRYWSSSSDEFISTNSVSGSQMKLSPDKCSCTINSRNKLELISIPNDTYGHLSRYILELYPKNDGRGLSLAFDALTLPAQIKTGKTVMKLTSGSPFYVFHGFIPIGTVTATVSLSTNQSRELSGYATFLHGIQSYKPHLISTRWDMFQLLDGPSKSAYIMLQFKTPSHFAKQAITQSIIVQDGKIICASTKAYARHLTSSIDKESGYPIPQTIEYKWLGETVDGHPIEIKSMVTSEKLITRLDILANLPYLLRKILQALIAKPFTFYWWQKGKVEVDVSGKKQELEGMIFHETTYVNTE